MSSSCSISRLTVFWTALFVAMLTLRVWKGAVGEYYCNYVMIKGLIIVYGFGFRRRRCFSLWRWPSSDSSNSNSHDDNDNENANDSDSNPDNDTTADEGSVEVTTMRPHTPEVSRQSHSSSYRNRHNSSRMPFLDNCKTFLTALVVFHHVGCAFGGATEDSWYLIIGYGGPLLFQKFVKSLLVINQSYFMSLFFFVSAYFCAPSYNSAGTFEAFRIRKRNRILIPALLETFVVDPLTKYVAGYRDSYFPGPGVGWFLYWLLLFQLVYSSFRWVRSTTTESTAAAATTTTTTMNSTTSINDESRYNDEEPLLSEPDDGGSCSDVDSDDAVLATTTTSEAFPSTKLRIVCGIGVCGILVGPFLALQLGSFISMPVSVGSMTADFFAFYLGLRAYDQKWFENGHLLSDKLDTSPKVLVAMVAAECFGLVTIFLETDYYADIQSGWVGILLIALFGMFCLDMSLLVLMVFQTFGNYETPLTVFLAKSAYGVYLLHPLVVTGTTALFVRLCGESGVNGYLYPIGFLLVSVVSHSVCWPLAYFLAHLPYLRKIL